MRNDNYRLQEERSRLIKIIEYIKPQQNLKVTTQWLWNSNGSFSVASCYSIITYKRIRSKESIIIWCITASSKIKAFLCLVYRNALLTWNNLQRRGWSGQERYILCNQVEENIQYLFKKCIYMLSVYSNLKSTRSWERENN